MTQKHDHAPDLVDVISDYLQNIGLNPEAGGRIGDKIRSLYVDYHERSYHIQITDLDAYLEHGHANRPESATSQSEL